MKNANRLLAVLTALLLTGCSLARPEAPPLSEDRFIGFHLVWENSGTPRQDFYSNPNLTNHGASSINLNQYGTLSLPNEVLFATEQDGRYLFPGLEGYSLFLLSGTGDGGAHYSQAISDMDPGETAIQDTDTGISHTLQGVIHIGPPLGTENWDLYTDNSVWTAYRVFQAPDGRPYLDGSGNSFTGTLGTYTETQSYTTAENGETVQEDSISVTVSMEAVPRLERLTVTEFDAQNAIVSSTPFALTAPLELHCKAAAVWVLIEEASQDGIVRTVYNVPAEDGDPIFHPIILLNDDGIGHEEYLQIS